MSRITITKRERLTYVPDGQDDVPDDERFSLAVMPMSLATEERVLDSIQEQQAEGHAATGSTALINEVSRTSIVGWANTGLDWDESYSGNVPDDVLVGIDFAVRAGLFGFLLQQAGMRSEVVVGESE